MEAEGGRLLVWLHWAVQAQAQVFPLQPLQAVVHGGKGAGQCYDYAIDEPLVEALMKGGRQHWEAQSFDYLHSKAPMN